MPVAVVHCIHIVKEYISCDNLATARKHDHICISGIPVALKEPGKLMSVLCPTPLLMQTDWALRHAHYDELIITGC